MEEVRNNLEKLIKIKGINNKEVLILSQKLDTYILSYYKKDKLFTKKQAVNY